MKNNAVGGLSGIDRTTEDAFERRDAPVSNPARHDQTERLEVGGHVQRKAVAGNPPSDPDADRGELVRPDPDAGQAVDAAGLDTEIVRRSDEDLFEVAHVAVHVAPI